MKMDHIYLLPWLRIARAALRDADLFDDMAERLGISDERMTAMRDELEAFLEGEQ
jgi:hypothetical protein